MRTRSFAASSFLAALLLSAVAPHYASAQLAVLDPKGIADSTSALQSTINASAGGRFTLPPGSYSITALTLPKNGISISGSGVKLVLGATAKDGQPMIRIPAGASNISLEGLEIDGQSNAFPQFKRISGIVSAGHSSAVVIKNIHFHDLSLSAVELSNADAHWELAGNHIERMGRHGIAVDYLQQQAHDIFIHDNHIEYCAFSPITLISDANDVNSAGAVNVNISKNYVAHNGLDIAGYSPNNKDIMITENTIESNGILNKMGHAIHFAGSNIVITKNIARNTAISAIVISGAPNSNPTPVEGFNISDNVIENVLS